jgi:hypothetical protein
VPSERHGVREGLALRRAVDPNRGEEQPVEDEHQVDEQQEWDELDGDERATRQLDLY